MRADRWSACPRCEARHKKKCAKSKVKLDSRYGKVSIRDWEKLQARHIALIDQKLETTFREDYEVLPLEGGEVVFDYRGSCTECKLSTKFTHVHPIEGIDD